MTLINIASKLTEKNDTLRKDLNKIEEIMNKIDTLDDVPSTAASRGKKGQIKVDTGFIYVCTADNTWKRVAIATF
jgi:hypothetical protein